jgi:hypothetical protein
MASTAPHGYASKSVQVSLPTLMALGFVKNIVLHKLLEKKLNALPTYGSQLSRVLSFHNSLTKYLSLLPMRICASNLPKCGKIRLNVESTQL